RNVVEASSRVRRRWRVPRRAPRREPATSGLRTALPACSFAPHFMSTERRNPSPFDHFEPKWQRLWDERQTFHAPNPGDPGFDPARPKYYVLDMFPYPSGAGLHVGHPEGYTA